MHGQEARPWCCGRAVGSWVGRTGGDKMEALGLWHCPATTVGWKPVGLLLPSRSLPGPRPILGLYMVRKWPQAYCFGCGLPCHDAIEHLRA